MDYATHYDVGDRKRDGGINEDSVAVSVFEQGHREGFRGYDRDAPSGDETSDSDDEGRDADERGDGTGSEDSDTEGDATADGHGDRDDCASNRSAAVFALADGAGGHDAGDAASYIATTAVCEHLAGTAVSAARSEPGGFDVAVDEPLPAPPRAAEMESAVAEAVVAAHREVLEYAADADEQAHATVVAGVCVGGRCHYGWVGDSRAYVVNAARDEILPLTTDHAVVQRLRDAGEIDDVEALVHPRGNEITRALGGSGRADPETATVDVETATVPLYREDVLLVTSDGLLDAQTEAAKLYEWYVDAGRDDEMAAVVRDRAVTDEEIREAVLSAPSLGDAAERLVELANERGGKDNCSTVLLHDGTLPPTPEDPPARAAGARQSVTDRETLLEHD
ncbi:protein phosphatase 2C [Halosimplex carlsbadense 2-9-1]|uniref:Protein phosphatase 2C n=1 Tax=Halosimplex carlsbadense 2-9-1 TaxID=797114 RepID=M0CR27_9EURY|nr:protein phosphatase 2C domain-containing protein [Halosimplex carlsbadense]ELZ25715.1 protein phosphatase 2C [Halosimplex carlsbadense 2-9-1]